jgi:hypothetical protein
MYSKGIEASLLIPAPRISSYITIKFPGTKGAVAFTILFPMSSGKGHVHDPWLNYSGRKSQISQHRLSSGIARLGSMGLVEVAS